MGYTHYFTQKRDFSISEWETVCDDIRQIIKHSEMVQGITLCDAMGEPRTRPEISKTRIAFNGSGDDSHETFQILRKREPVQKGPWARSKGWDFTKTNRKPYDHSVTACLCYLGSVAESHSVTSDGKGRDWLAGLELAKQALPAYGNQLDIPREILEDDRWISPWASLYTKKYTLNFCVDGHAYIGHGNMWYRFHSHHEAALWMQTHIEPMIKVTGRFAGGRQEGGKSIFDASGSFDDSRNRKLARLQDIALGKMIELSQSDPSHAISPPAFVRPGELVAMEKPLAYSISDLLALA